MSISRSYNKQNNTTYVYEVIENYWDKEKKQPRSKRKLIGKIDPVTGEIVPTASRKKATDGKEADYKKLYESAQKEIAKKDKLIHELEELLREYLTEEMAFLLEVENTIKTRRNKAEALLRKQISRG